MAQIIQAYESNPAPDENMLNGIAAIRHQHSIFIGAIENYAPSSRERSIALTKLEEAAMWAIKAITHNA